MRWAIVSLRRLGDERVAALGFLCLVLVTAFVAALGPRALEAVADRSLRTELGAVTPLDRDLELSQVVPSDPDTPASLAIIDAAGVRLRATFPAPIQGVTGPASSIVDMPSVHVASGTTLDSTLTLQIQPGIESRIRLTGGHLPTGQIHGFADPRSAPGSVPLTALEVAISRAAALKMRHAVGATLPVEADPLDPYSANVLVRAAVQVVGIYDPVDPADPDLDAGCRASCGLVAACGDVEFIDAKALLSPDIYSSLLRLSATTTCRPSSAGATGSIRRGSRRRVKPA